MGRDEMTRKIQCKYLWPKARPWIKQYVKGCAICQQNKNLTHRPQIPLFKILVPENAPLFTQIAMDQITGLPKSRGHDTILTIVDHGCTRAALFLPCLTTIMGPQIAKLYYQHIYPWFGLPKKLISEGVSKRAGHHMEPLNGIPSLNGWTYGKEESVGGAILMPGHDQSRGLVHNATPCHIGTQ